MKDLLYVKFRTVPDDWHFQLLARTMEKEPEKIGETVYDLNCSSAKSIYYGLHQTIAFDSEDLTTYLFELWCGQFTQPEQIKMEQKGLDHYSKDPAFIDFMEATINLELDDFILLLLDETDRKRHIEYTYKVKRMYQKTYGCDSLSELVQAYENGLVSEETHSKKLNL